MLVSLLNEHWLLSRVKQYYTFVLGFPLLTVGLIGIQLLGVYGQGPLFGLLPGLAGLGMAQICIGTSAFIFHDKMDDKKLSRVLAAGTASTVSSAIFLLLPFLNVGNHLIIEFSGVFSGSFGMMIFVDTGVASGWLRVRPVYITGLFLIIAGLILLYITGFRNHTAYVYLSSVPVLSGGLLVFSVLGRKKSDWWMYRSNT